MAAKIQRIHADGLLAPSRLVTGLAMRDGHEMGVAATAAELEFELLEFVLDDADFHAVECAMSAVRDAHAGYHWRRPMSEDEFTDLELGIVWERTVADRLRDQQTRLKKIRDAVAAGNRWLPQLMRRDLVLVVTTVKVEYGPVPQHYMPEYPFRALVSVEPVG